MTMMPAVSLVKLKSGFPISEVWTIERGHSSIRGSVDVDVGIIPVVVGLDDNDAGSVIGEAQIRIAVIDGGLQSNPSIFVVTHVHAVAFTFHHGETCLKKPAV